jgi:hypothetical protein
LILEVKYIVLLFQLPMEGGLFLNWWFIDFACQLWSIGWRECCFAFCLLLWIPKYSKPCSESESGQMWIPVCGSYGLPIRFLSIHLIVFIPLRPFHSSAIRMSQICLTW